jgi:hypothetical protein
VVHCCVPMDEADVRHKKYIATINLLLSCSQLPIMTLSCAESHLACDLFPTLQHQSAQMVSAWKTHVFTG